MIPQDQQSHSTMKNLTRNFDFSSFVPKMTYTYNTGTKIIVVTDASTIPGGMLPSRFNVEVHDEKGASVNGTFVAGAGNTGNLNVASLDASKPLTIKATIVLDSGWYANGSVKGPAAAGDLGGWSVAESAASAS